MKIEIPSVWLVGSAESDRWVLYIPDLNLLLVGEWDSSGAGVIKSIKVVHITKTSAP
jgi:hypothetical protein